MIHPSIIANGFEAAWWLVFGLALGSFVNVVIHRLPRSRSLWRPVSHCPRCRAPINYRDNIPVLGWLLLRGRCRHCAKPISCRYPLVEALNGAAALGLWWRYRGDPVWTALAICAASALLAVAFIDLDTFLIPNELSLGLLAAGLLLAPLNPVFAGGAWLGWGPSFGGALAGLAICWGVAAFGEWAFKREAMGGGDIKLLAAVGAWSGWLGAFDCLIVASFLGAAYGVALLARRKLRRRDAIPFGPFLSLAGVLNFFVILPFGFPFALV